MSIKYSDSGFLDGADETKKLSFDVSGVTTGTTRTITMPDGDTKLYTGDGTSGQVLTSGGVGVAPTFQTAAAGGISNVVEDTTPQLGGTLDLNSKEINFGTNTWLKANAPYIEMAVASSFNSVSIIDGTSTSNMLFRFRSNGNGTCDGSWTGGGADYAEYFEWADGNLNNEDRRGISVVLDGEKIRLAVDGDLPIGVISGRPAVVGDGDINKWKYKYLRDVYGSYIREIDPKLDQTNLPDNNDGMRNKQNPNYDNSQTYISREERQEWDTVGLMGKLRIRKGQPVAPTWIKMRDISDEVEEWLVK